MVDTVVVPADNSGPTLEEQNAAQEAAAKAALENTPDLEGEESSEDEERPEWLPEKFKSVEDMAKAYSELEKAQSQRGSKEDGDDGEDGDAAEKAVEAAGLDMDALSAEWETNGSLTQESLDKLAAVGITPDMVEMYAAGVQSTTQATQAQLLEPVGGSIEAYDELVAWASDNLEERAIDNFNTVLDTGNTEAIKLAVKNLNDQYVDANGYEPTVELGGASGGTGSTKYESTEQLMKDMNNPAYAKDPAFRAKVEAKLARSSIL